MLINYGYTIKTKDLKADYQTARKIMNSKNRLKFSRVDCDGDKFIFRTEKIECPICHAKYDAREIMPSEPVIHTSYEIERFFDPQLDISNYNNNHSIQLNKAIFKDKPSITCPFCHNTIYKTNAKRKILLDRDSEKATVKVQLKNVKELINCLLSVSDKMTIDIGNEILNSSWEVITLDKEGKTYLSFENESNNETYRKDITEDFDTYDIDTCLSIINNNEKVKDYIIEFLRTFWDTEFPFNAKDLELADIIALNRFKGFDESYYYAIPYELGTYIIEDSFKVFSNSRDAINAFQNSSLHKSKIIKKAIFKNQGLLLYIPELECLYSDIGNASIFNEIINASYIQVLLYYLHTYPSINQFISDYCTSSEQTRKLANLLKQSVGLTCELAKDYAVRSDFYKRKMLEGHFKNDTVRIERLDRDYYYQPRTSINAPYSMPMKIPQSVLKLEDTVFDCNFRFLRTTNETRRAGKILCNCLTGWNCTDENVLVIKRGISIVAAIQLSHRNTRVEQAKLAHNDDVEDNEKIYKAFRTWCNKHRLTYPERYWYDDDDNDEEEIA